MDIDIISVFTNSAFSHEYRVLPQSLCKVTTFLAKSKQYNIFSTCFLRKNPNFSSVILHIYDLLVLLHRTQKTRRYIMPESEAGGSPVFFMVDTEDRRLPIVQCLACHRTCVPLSCRWTQKIDGSPLSSVWLAIGLVFHFLVGGHRRSTALHCPVSLFLPCQASFLFLSALIYSWFSS